MLPASILRHADHPVHAVDASLCLMKLIHQSASASAETPDYLAVHPGIMHGSYTFDVLHAAARRAHILYDLLDVFGHKFPCCI